MAITPYANPLSALFAHLKANAEITALTGDRISFEVKDDWGFQAREKAKYAIVIPGMIGGPGEIGPAMLAWRYDLTCYGPNRLSATNLMNFVLGYLIPQDRQQSSFTAAGVIVQSIALEGGPNVLTEPDTRWERSTATIIPRFISVSTS